jgi:hypothetical protein
MLAVLSLIRVEAAHSLPFVLALVLGLSNVTTTVARQYDTGTRRPAVHDVGRITAGFVPQTMWPATRTWASTSDQRVHVLCVDSLHVVTCRSVVAPTLSPNSRDEQRC